MGKLLSYLNTKTFRKNLIVAILSVSVFLFLLFFSLRFYTRHGEGTPVPKLKGLSIEKAIEILEAKGLRYQVDSIYQMDRTPGLVIEQDPDANTSVKLNRTIYLTIITSKAPDVNFPDVFESNYLEARAILSNYGIKIGDTTYASDIVRDRVLQVLFKGKVIRKGDPIPKGSLISIVLGDGGGASEVDLPDLRGLSLSEAKFALKGSSLKPGSIFYEGNITDSASAKVVKQYPALNDSISKVQIGSTVDIVLSNEALTTN